MAGSTDRVRPDAVLTAADRALLRESRTATLATVAPDGLPRLVPICYAVEPADDVIWTPLDEKPKAVDDVRALARVRDILARADVALLVQRWSEDWSELAWLRLGGRGALVESAPFAIVAALRSRYPQYADHDLQHRPVLRIAIDHVTRWSAAGP